MVHDPPSAAAAGERVVERGSLRVEIGLAPLRIHVRRARRRLLRALTVWACEGEVRDRFVQVTEGVHQVHVFADYIVDFSWEHALWSTVRRGIVLLPAEVDHSDTLLIVPVVP